MFKKVWLVIVFVLSSALANAGCMTGQNCIGFLTPDAFTTFMLAVRDRGQDGGTVEILKALSRGDAALIARKKCEIVSSTEDFGGWSCVRVDGTLYLVLSGMVECSR